MLQTFYLFLLMAGAIQGIVMGILLWNNKKSPQIEANRFLAAILFFFSYRLIVETLYGLGFQNGILQKKIGYIFCLLRLNFFLVTS